MYRHRTRAAAAAVVALLVALMLAVAGTASADPSDWLGPQVSAEAVNPAYAGASGAEAKGLPAGTVVSSSPIQVNIEGAGPVEATQLQVIDQDGRVAVVTLFVPEGVDPSSAVIYLPPTDAHHPQAQPSYTLKQDGSLTGDTVANVRDALNGGSAVIVPDSYGQRGQYAGVGNGERVSLLSQAAVNSAGLSNVPVYATGWSGGAIDAARLAEYGMPNLAGVWLSAAPADGTAMLEGARNDVTGGVIILRAGTGLLDSIVDQDPALAGAASAEISPTVRLLNTEINKQLAIHPEYETYFMYLGLLGLSDAAFTKNGQMVGPHNPALAEVVNRATLGQRASTVPVVGSCASNDQFLDCIRNTQALIARYQAMGVDAQFSETPIPAWPHHGDPSWSDKLPALSGNSVAPSTIPFPNTFLTQENINQSNLIGLIAGSIAPTVGPMLTSVLHTIFSITDYFVAPQEMLSPVFTTTPAVKVTADQNPVSEEAPVTVESAPVVSNDPVVQAQEAWQDVTAPVTRAIEAVVKPVPAVATIPVETGSIEAAAELATQAAPQYTNEINVAKEVIAASPFAQQANDFLAGLPLPAPAQ